MDGYIAEAEYETRAMLKMMRGFLEWENGDMYHIKVKHRFIVLTIVFLFIFSACSVATPVQSYFPEEHQVRNYADGEISTFGLNVAPADTMGDWVVNWLSGASDGDGFQYFVYADPDSWDVYIHYPDRKHEIQALTNADITVDFTDGCLRVYVTENSSKDISEDEEKDWVLHFAAYPFGVWPSEVELYWNGHEVPCDDIYLTT